MVVHEVATIGMSGEWTPAEEAILGTDTDKRIAHMLGRDASRVSARRRYLGIPLFKRALPKEIDELLGTAQDYVIAAKFGVKTEAISRRRNELGIPTWRQREAGKRGHGRKRRKKK